MRRPFSFRLARVLRIRALEEKLARAAWAEAQGEAHLAEARREAEKEALDAARDSVRSALTSDAEGPLNLDAIRLGHELADRQLHRLRSADEDVLTKEQQAERMAEAWRERDRKKKALERLEERQRERHDQETREGEND